MRLLPHSLPLPSRAQLPEIILSSTFCFQLGIHPQHSQWVSHPLMPSFHFFFPPHILDSTGNALCVPLTTFILRTCPSATHASQSVPCVRQKYWGTASTTEYSGAVAHLHIHPLEFINPPPPLLDAKRSQQLKVRIEPSSVTRWIFQKYQIRSG